MSRKHKLSLFGVLALACVAAGVAVVALQPRTAINAANAATIRKGQSLAEVEAILGGSARDESSVLLTEDTPDIDPEAGLLGAHRRPLLLQMLAMQEPAARKLWASNSLMVLVYFDADDRVTDCSCIPVRGEQENGGCIDRVRRWLNL